MSQRDLIDYAEQDDGVNFRSAMYAAIHDKVTAHIEAKKHEIAQNLMSTESVEDLDEKAKWRNSSAAKDVSDPEAHDKHDKDGPGQYKSISDTPTSQGSLLNRRKATTSTQGPRQGMATKQHMDSLKNRIRMNKEEVLDEDTMTHIKLGKKIKNDEGGHDQDVHHKGVKIGSISSYKHGSGTKYAMSHDASGDSTTGSRSPEEAIDDLRFTHAQHLKS
jgi:hypothetical protein